MLAANTLLRRWCRSGTPTLPLLSPQLLLHTSTAHSYSKEAASQQQQPLSLFVCAVDEASDQAGAALVAALKQLTGRPVQLHGVGGRELAHHGLQSVVTDEQLQSLAAAEIVPPTYRLLPGSSGDSISKTSYAKLFKDVIWEAALDGCRGRPAASSAQQQGAKVPASSSSSTSSSSASQQQQPAEQPALCYDAVLAVGSPTAAQLTLNFLRQAEKMNKARLPLMVQYMVPGLWDHQQARVAASRWSKLVDHVLCALPFEPPLLHAAGVPSSFVGHPLLQQLLGSSTSVSSFGGKARLLTNLLQQQQQLAGAAGEAPARPQQQGRSRGQQPTSLFAAGDAAAFWRCYEQARSVQQEAAAAEAAAAQQQQTQQPQQASTVAASSAAQTQQQVQFSSKRRAQQQQQQQQQSQQQRQQQSQQQEPRRNSASQQLLVSLLPGTTEAEVISSLPAFDQITQQLQQRHPGLLATLHVPEVLVPAAVHATVNFSVPVLVVAAGEKQAADALAASAAAISHPGPASLTAVAAGLPLICVRDGPSLTGVWTKWRQRHLLPFSSIPNLLLGRAAVAEFDIWRSGSLEAAVAAMQQLLQARLSTAAAGDGSHVQQQQQRAVLQEALLRLVAPAQRQQQQQAAVTGSSWQLPAEAAAWTLLELMQLRQQQEAGRAVAAATAGSTAGSSRSRGRSSSQASAAGQPEQQVALSGS